MGGMGKGGGGRAGGGGEGGRRQFAIHIFLGNSSVVIAPDSRENGRGFESLQERQDFFFLLRVQHSVLTLISVSVPPPCYRSST